VAEMEEAKPRFLHSGCRVLEGLMEMLTYLELRITKGFR
jgi:hypothetical protein